MIFATRFAVFVPPALALLGCTTPNPAFEGGGDEEIGAATDTRGEDESESGESESGESGESTSETEGEDDETSSTIDDGEATDATETGMNECANPGAPLLPFIDDPEMLGQCGPYIPKPVRVHEVDQLAGRITVEECGPGCDPCFDKIYDFGVLGLEALVDKYAALLEDPGANQMALCLTLEAGPPLGLIDGVCAYPWLVARSSGQPVLFASRHATVLDDAASFTELGPQVGQGFAACDCEQLLSEPEAIDCCAGYPGETGVPSLVYQGVEALPGDTHPIMLGGVGWQYHVAHAYTSAIGLECTTSPDGVQKSWAIVRN